MRKLFFLLTEIIKTSRSSNKSDFRPKKTSFFFHGPQMASHSSPDNRFWAHIYMIRTQNFMRNKIFFLTEAKKIHPKSENLVFCWNIQRMTFIFLIWHKLLFRHTYSGAKFDGENTFLQNRCQENSFNGSKMRFLGQKHPFLTKKWSKTGVKKFFSLFF